MKRDYLFLAFFIVSTVLFLQAGCPVRAESAEKPEEALPESKPEAAPSEKAKIVPEANEPSPVITFESTVYDFGEIGPGARIKGEFKFKNTGDGILKIKDVQKCCGATVKLSKKEFAPGESGVLKVTYRAIKRPTSIKRHLYVNSNDKANPRVDLTIKAQIRAKVKCEPKSLNLLLKEENAGCPEITLKSMDNKPFSIKSFKSTSDSIVADVNALEEARKFVIQPKVDIEKLKKNLNGFIEIGLTHPIVDKVTVTYNALPEFKLNPPVIILFKAEHLKPVKRDIWVLSNYGEDFEIESVSSKNGIVKVMSQEKVSNGYHLEVEITPPAGKDNKKIFTDVFSVNIKGGKKLEIKCRGFYEKGKSSKSS